MNWKTIFKRHYSNLIEDVYPQPSDIGHVAWASDVIHDFELIHHSGKSILDVGCGDGFCKPLLEAAGLSWTGVALDQEPAIDFHFLPFEDNSYDIIFARHVLEHSPMPLLALMEWHRVVKDEGYLLLVMPSPEFWKVKGKNHYSVFPKGNIEWWLKRSGWHTRKYESFTNHHRLFLDTSELDEKQKKTVLDKAAIPVEYRWWCQAGEKVIS